MEEQIVEQTESTVETLEQPQPIRQPEPPVNGFWWGTGRRKSAVARVRIRDGKGKIIINGRNVDEFFSQERDRTAVRAPLKDTGNLDRIDVLVKVSGGGFTGQAGAVVLGISRALRKKDPSAESVLRDKGYLTRDPRMKERKKYGRRGARRSFQFSKR